MKTVTKFAIGTMAMVAVSAGVAGVTAYTVAQKAENKDASFTIHLRLQDCVRLHWIRLPCNRLI